MGLQIIRFKQDNEEKWGVIKGHNIIALPGTYSTLNQFLEEGVSEAHELLESGTEAHLSLDKVEILSPVTTPARIVCQGANYSSHREESGLEAQRPPFNMFFSKADSSLSGAYADIVRPSHVKLLDYEIELGLIIGKEISAASQITEENLHEYIAGLVLVNDVSARDVQLPEGQWLKGKSYRTFCPTGPFLYLLDQEEIAQIHDLELNLWVNDELRQSANTNQLLFKPTETLAELADIMDLSVGDLVITGTTGGVALNVPSEVINEILNPFVPGNKKMELLLDSQLKSDKYLSDGDVVRAEIKSSDGSISLGVQQNKIVPEKAAVAK
ncbi:fumarylacetoacetate hydrolase family protein [Planococcus shenhongbingii]|uniref:Fumarylacetoacetate hydrolase family protein n=1 Tax=Planococcus shenhongbingii TaxID=3058398 RepID=A0ABT8NGZ0_9BACL|nr:fumarylacetoacetate hydrolase family protein [Planococcus sp. N017]MDN7247169.1 fumarylacetoacetate hydrolase family protein [Planococcus sp. N017]